MIRTQIQLTEEQSETLRRESLRAGLSVAELIRRSIDRFLEETRIEAAGAGRLDALKIIGMFHSETVDVSIRHDDYLDECYLPPRP